MDDIKRRQKIAKEKKSAPKLEEDFLLTKIEPEETNLPVELVPVALPPPSMEETKITLSEEPKTIVKVSFAKFVQLVASHDFEKILQSKSQEEITLSSDLLTDLANAHNEDTEDSRKIPLVFVFGVLLGIILTYLIIKY